MTKKDLEERIRDLEQEINIQKLYINQLEFQLNAYQVDKNVVEPQPPFNPDSFPKMNLK